MFICSYLLFPDKFIYAAFTFINAALAVIYFKEVSVDKMTLF